MTDLEINQRSLKSSLKGALDVHSEEPLKAVMDYALNGGKHLRGLLVMATTDSCGGNPALAIKPAVAIELIHAASLAVDDLPAFDESRTRRGRPSLHCQFGEAHAILAAHALVAMAFQVLSASPFDSARVLQHVRLVSAAVGGRGMTLGELLDLEKETESSRTVDTLKTAILFQTAVEIGGLVADVDASLLGELRDLGAEIGCSYQALDDLEDASVDAVDWVNLHRRFERQWAATQSKFEAVRSGLVEPAPLAQWLDHLSILQGRR